MPPNASPAESWELPEAEEKKLGGDVGYRIILAKNGDEVRINVVEGYKHKILYRPTGWAKKWGHRLMTIILSNLNRFKRKI